MTWHGRLQAIFKNKRQVKTWLRCCVSLAVSLIFLVATDTDNLLGQAAFFTGILAVMLPPSFAISLFIMAASTLIVGMCLGWAWACAATAAAISVRDRALLSRQMQEVQASLVDGVSVQAQLQLAIFQGKFLDPRSSAVYGAFLFIGTFFLGTINAFRPKLAVLTIFATIILDVQCSYAPGFPTAQYTLVKLILIPSGFYIAIALVCLLLIFPESLNHVWLTILGDGVLKPIHDIFNLQVESLSIDPGDKEGFAALFQRGKVARAMLVGGYQGLQGQIALIDLEPSVGRLGAHDLKEINKELRGLAIQISGMHTFLNAVNDMHTQRLHVGQGRAATRLKRLNEKEIEHGHDLTSLLPLLQAASTALLGACGDGMDKLEAWVQDCNSGRWTWLISSPSPQRIAERKKGLEGCVAKLKQAMEEFENVERVRMIKPFEKCFDPVTGKPLSRAGAKSALEADFSVRSLFICFTFLDTLGAFAFSLHKMLTLVVRLDAERPRPRVWMPIGMGSLGGKLKGTMSADTDVNPIAMGTPTDPFKFESAAGSEETVAETGKDVGLDDDGVHRRARDPDALAPKTALGRFSLKVAAFIRFLRSPQGVFALRYAIVSVALWIPTVCLSSTWFTYNNRGLWALIMAQTGLSVFAGDQIFSFIARLSATIFGLLLGLVCWYIGAGSGNGNAYGIVVVSTFFIAPFLFMEINAAPALRPFWTMIGVTAIFVVGYSWVDKHQAVSVNPGAGIHLAWKRALLIIIGFTAGFIVMMFPRPTSSRVFVRKSLAADLDELSHILAAEVEAFLAEERRARDGFYEKVKMVGEGAEATASPKELRMRRFTPKMLAVSTRLQELNPSLQTARLEPQVRGMWPAEMYKSLHDKEGRILMAMILLVGALSRLDTKWCSILVHHTPFMNPNFLADVFMHISILSSSLAHSTPLPPTFPSLRDRLVYHERVMKQRQRHEQCEEPQPDDASSVDGDSPEAPGKVDGSSIGFKELSLSVLMDPQLPPHSTAVIALSNIITLIDDVSGIVKELCGETTFPSLDVLHRHYLTMEEEATNKQV
ncbi:hypothetical protein BDZ89DRAFT_1063889 [Hymenopellis radicata]|nr:hypothetical protein BDZ89DRAFT_1063889 [Hymenopellis radicata]